MRSATKTNAKVTVTCRKQVPRGEVRPIRGQLPEEGAEGFGRYTGRRGVSHTLLQYEDCETGRVNPAPTQHAGTHHMGAGMPSARRVDQISASSTALVRTLS